MICTRCKKTISFSQWHAGLCSMWTVDQNPDHHLTPEDIRQAYDRHLLEAAYARSNTP